MATRLSNVIVYADLRPPRDYGRSGVSNDWERDSVEFPPGMFPSDDIHIIPGTYGAHDRPAVVPVVRSVTASGFELAGRNSDVSRGDAGLSYIAFCETNVAQKRQFTLRTGVVPPKEFKKTGQTGDRQSWSPLRFLSEFSTKPVVMAAPTNLNVRQANPAVVSLVHDVNPSGFTLSARNSDSTHGYSSFYFLAAGQGGEMPGDAWFDAGRVGPFDFSSSGKSGDWQNADVYFHTAFIVPPMVFVAATDWNCVGENRPVVAIAQNVTTHGFFLAARNSDSAPGQSAFDWIAIGYAAVDHHREQTDLPYVRPEKYKYAKELTSASR